MERTPSRAVRLRTDARISVTSTYCGEASRRTLGQTSCLISTSSWGLISQLVGLAARQPAPSQGPGKTSSSEFCKVEDTVTGSRPQTCSALRW